CSLKLKPVQQTAAYLRREATIDLNKLWNRRKGTSSKVSFGTRRDGSLWSRVPPIYMLTYSIPENFGGMTNVLLHRARSFAEQGGRQVDVLTIDADMDLAATKARLDARGYLGDSKVRLRNLWYEMGELSDVHLAELVEGLDEPFVEDTAIGREHQKGMVCRRNVEGKLLQVDRYRSDGTLWVIDRRDTHQPDSVGGRRITLYSRGGQPLGQWTRPSEFYFLWLDSVVGHKDAVLISDSQFIGGFIHNYNRTNVVLTQVIHSTHLDANASDAYSPLSRGKQGIIRNADGFDLLTVLTESQKSDVRAADLAGSNLRVVPNSRSLGKVSGTEVRPNGQGVMISRLTSPKRVEDAVRAATWAHSHLPEVNLKIYGEGAKRADLERLIKQLNGEDAVSLEGYDSKASEYFKDARFSVLSSRSEGFGLVVVESLAAGCIPISYNINYGPSDIITDGVDGFLVPSGDVHGLAAAIHRVAVMDRADVDRMRDAAVLRSRDFSDHAVMRVWLKELAEA